MIVAELKKTAEGKMQKSLEALKGDLLKVRTGRAHTGLLDHVIHVRIGSRVCALFCDTNTPSRKSGTSTILVKNAAVAPPWPSTRNPRKSRS